MENIEILIETYNIMIQYIPNKDKQEMADHLISSLVDLLTEEDLAEIGGIDSYIKKALKEYNIAEENNSDEDDD